MNVLPKEADSDVIKEVGNILKTIRVADGEIEVNGEEAPIELMLDRAISEDEVIWELEARANIGLKTNERHKSYRFGVKTKFAEKLRAEAIFEKLKERYDLKEFEKEW